MQFNNPSSHGPVPTTEGEDTATPPPGDEARADVSTEPETNAFPQSPVDGKPQRRITFTWLVSTNDSGHEVLVELSCHHTRGFYVATLNNVVRTSAISTLYSPLDTHRLVTESVARYAKPGFEAFAQRALAELRSGADTADIAAYLRGEHAVEELP